ncbi:MAG TPA: bifunctional demethylmenaquinone methyltransferase/2-methoxy-6-polyprenyl-1,4-benzoquinol methylase UbiE [Thermodesulfobacteriota bacterium]|jgi:demethylmenaquinone methyltransferase/2-methoxy-6-polyprenyl-1,4-benzoquinol methylase|nr:bifunctional demethylmenaquinone methyltransferase/2-methoxy-6-polyprenyl-1,4-benzoquinol methylase UbiE [Thermodesulfobacteriota bacterium]
MKTYFLHPESIRSLFDNIAPTYDLLNHLLSLGRDIYWRKIAVQELKGLEGWILDIATGTGDVAMEMIHQSDHQRKVSGLDFSEPMIKKAKQKVFQKGLSQTITLSLGDALSLPFRDNTFSASLIAFGLRNIVQKERALSEMVRVIKTGGKVVILEFTFPPKGLMRRIYPIYFQRVLPRVGGLISGDRGAYAYLPESVFHFASVENYEGLMRKAGLGKVGSQSLTGGVASVISGMKKRQ